MSLERIKAQIELSKKSILELSNQNRIFDEVLESAKKGADPKDSKEIEKVESLAKRAIALAQNGKSNKAQELINNFKRQYGSKDIK